MLKKQLKVMSFIWLFMVKVKTKMIMDVKSYILKYVSISKIRANKVFIIGLMFYLLGIYWVKNPHYHSYKIYSKAKTSQ